MEFVDRHDGGRHLAEALLALAHERPIVIALPRGGVPVGFEVAKRLEAPLDILAVRKLGAPGNPEFAVGAIAEDGTVLVEAEVARRVGMTQTLFDATVERELRELHRRVERYRDGRPPADVDGRTVILVDDGLATGLTVIAGVRALRGRGAGRIVVAVPVGARESVALVAQEADQVVCTTIPRELVSVGRWYGDFSAVGDEEVLDLLHRASKRGQVPHRDGTARGTSREPDSRDDREVHARELMLEIDGVTLAGDLRLPESPAGLVIFAHGSGSSRLSPRNRAVAAALGESGLATLLFDLLTPEEAPRRELVFAIPLLARRLELATQWALEDPDIRELPIGYFGASTGAAAALRAAAAAAARSVIRAVVSRGGRPDLAADRLPHVRAPTLLLVGDRDPEVLELNRRAAALLTCPHRLTVVAGAGHLFEEPGTLETVSALAATWFTAHLAGAPAAVEVAG